MTLWAIAIVLLATFFDMREGRIPNMLTLPALGLTLVFQALYGHTLEALAGAGVVIPLTLLAEHFFAMSFGGGDIKLFLAIGASIGVLGFVKVMIVLIALIGLMSFMPRINRPATPLILMALTIAGFA